MVSRGGSRHTALCVLTSFYQKQPASPTSDGSKLKSWRCPFLLLLTHRLWGQGVHLLPSNRSHDDVSCWTWSVYIKLPESNVILRFIISSLYLIKTWQKLQRTSISDLLSKWSVIDQLPSPVVFRWGAGRMNATRWFECDLRLSPVTDGCITLMFYPLDGAESESRVVLVFLCWYQSGSRCLRLEPQQLEVEFRTRRCRSLSPGAEPSAGSGRLQIQCKHWTMTLDSCIYRNLGLILSLYLWTDPYNLQRCGRRRWDLLAANAAATTEPQKHSGTWWCAENCERNETTWSQNLNWNHSFLRTECLRPHLRLTE